MSCRYSFPPYPRNITPLSAASLPASLGLPSLHQCPARRSVSSGTFLLRSSFQQPEQSQQPQMALRKRYSYRDPDRTQRRRSANAEILESIGLPTTGSFNDMKSLQGSTLFEYDMSAGGDFDECEDLGCCCGLGRAVKALQSQLSRTQKSKTGKAKTGKTQTTPTPETASKIPEAPTAETKTRRALWKKKLISLTAVPRKLRRSDMLKNAQSSATARTAVEGRELEQNTRDKSCGGTKTARYVGQD